MAGVSRYRLIVLEIRKDRAEFRPGTEPKSLWAHIWPERGRYGGWNAPAEERYGVPELSIVSGASLGAGIVIC